MVELYKKLRFILDKNDKQALLFVFILSILISIVETAGVSLIMPFMSVAGDFTLIQSNEYYKAVYEFFNFNSNVAFVIAFGFVLVAYYILRGIFNLFYTYKLSQFSEGRFFTITSRIFQKYLNMYYKDYVTKNTSTLSKVLISDSYNLGHMISAVLLMISESMIVIVLYSLMLWVDWKVTVVLSVVLVVKVLFLTKVITKRIKHLGEEREEHHKRYYETINNTFRNFKYIKLAKEKTLTVNKFQEHSGNYVYSNIWGATLVQVPKVFLEMIGFGVIVLMIVYITYQEQTDISKFLPVITMFILALYRLLPSMNRIMNSYNQIHFYNKTLNIVYDELKHKVEPTYENNNLSFKDKIIFKDIEFSYIQDKNVLNNINLTITKGEKLAFIGESGSGKTTLVDMLIGLHQPTKGSILIDNIKITDKNISSWRGHIGYIPQNVFLFDGTVAENVVFGREYSEEKIIKALKKAQIYHFLQEKEGLFTKVGDAGVMLSGGQQQRIAIARALYGEPDILVLDEATSALDNKTEEEIMKEIYEVSKDITLVIIAHRLSTLKGCDKIYELSHGNLKEGNV